MKYLIVTIFSLLIIAFSACNTEEGLTPAPQNSYIKIIKGKGTDAPLSIQEFKGGLLIVSNSTIVKGENLSNKVRILRVNLSGEVISGSDKYYPENSDQNWNAKDVVLMDNDRILIGGTVGTNDSLFFLEVNAQLDSVNSQYYSSDLENYQLTGLSYNEATSKIFFGGSEWTNGVDEFTLFGEMNTSDLSIDQTYRSNKARALPATPILEDASGGLIWAYNAGNSVLVRSNNREMHQIENTDDLSFDGAGDVVSKKLIETEDGQMIILGELDSEGQRMLFFYKAYSGNAPFIFGGNGENQLNGVKKIENGYLIAGSTEISEEGSSDQLDFYLTRRTPGGAEGFSKSFGSDADEELHDAVMIDDHIYSIGSTVIGIENTLLLIKTDKFGELVN